MPNAPPNVDGHVSFSQLNEWLECGKAYELKRLIQVPEWPAWWNIGGHGVHQATERYDRQRFEEDGQ